MDNSRAMVVVALALLLSNAAAADMIGDGKTVTSLPHHESYGMNKLILSSYTTNQTGSDGVQWMDDWALSTTDF